MNDILAKSKNQKQNIEAETLIEHTTDLITLLNKIIQKIDFKFVEKNISKSIDFTEHLRNICVIHDLGKMNIKFQKKIELANKIDEIRCENKDDKRLENYEKEKNKIKDERHNILSCAFIKSIFQQLDINDEEIKSVLYKSIMLHHGNYEKYLVISNSQIEKAIYTDVEESIFLTNEYNFKAVEDFVNSQLHVNIKFDEKFLDYDYMYQLSENFRCNIYLQYLYIMFKGFLNVIDHLASTQLKNYNYFNPLSKEEIDSKLLDQIREKIKSDNVVFRPMQEKLREFMNNNVITEAFTGSGKTAADYRWYGTRKIFLVPNKISAESFYNDAEKILGEDNIGILHGDISLYVEEENSNVNNEGLSITLRDKNLSRNFAKPYIIATIDQILLSMFKYPGYEKVFASIYDLKITVDEVHLLNPKMFLILVYFMQFSSKYLNTKFHLMTATLPKAYKDKLRQSGIDFKNSNENEQVEENRKIQIKIIKDNEKNLKRIVEDALKVKNKVLIIKNTVDSAISVFEYLSKEKEFKNSDIRLLHSRFKFCDKKKKYTDILKQDADIWVSTQAVEISLDLDFQVVISDNCPMESIIQRMGRNNRHDTLEYGFFYCTDNCEKDVYDEVIKKSTLKLLKKFNNKVISMKDRKNLLQEYYNEKEICNYYDKGFENAENDIREIYGLKDEELSGQKIIFNYDPYLNIVDNKEKASKLFRDTDINAKIILEDDLESLIDKEDDDKKDLFKFYQYNSIQISKGYYLKLKNTDALYIHDGYLTVKRGYCTYDPHIGLLIKDKESIRNQVIEDKFF